MTSATSTAPSSSSAQTAWAVGQLAAAREHRQPREHPLLVVEQQVVAPVDDGLQGLLARQRRARAAGQQPEPVVQAGEDLVGRERTRAGGRQLDRQRQAVEAGADLADRPGEVVGELEASTGGRRSGDEQRRSRRRVRAGGPARWSRRRSAALRGSWPAARSRGQRRRRSSATSAAVAITCSQLSSTTSSSRSPITRPAAGIGQAEGGGDRAAHRRGVADRRQLDQAGTLAQPLDGDQRDLEREPRLADPARAHERDEAVLAGERGELADLGVAADQRGQRHRDAEPRGAVGVVGHGTRRARRATGPGRGSRPPAAQLGVGVEPELLAEDAATVAVATRSASACRRER